MLAFDLLVYEHCLFKRMLFVDKPMSNEKQEPDAFIFILLQSIALRVSYSIED